MRRDFEQRLLTCLISLQALNYPFFAKFIEHRAQKKIERDGHRRVIPSIPQDLFWLVVHFLLPRSPELFIPTLIRLFGSLNSVSFFSIHFTHELARSGLLEQFFRTDSVPKLLLQLEQSARDNVQPKRFNCTPDSKPILSRFGTWIAYATGARLKLIDVASGNCFMTLTGHVPDFGRAPDSISSFAISPNDRWIATVASKNPTIKIWDTRSWLWYADLKSKHPYTHLRAFSNDGDFLACSLDGEAIQIWDVEKKSCARILVGCDAWISACSFSTDASWLISGSLGSEVKIWDIVSATCLKDWKMDWGGEVLFCSLSRDKKHAFIFTDDGLFRMAEIETGKYSGFLCLKLKPTAFAMSPDERWGVIASYDNMLRIFNVEKWCFAATLNLGRTPVACQFSADGKKIAVKQDTGEINIFHLMATGGLISEEQEVDDARVGFKRTR